MIPEGLDYAVTSLASVLRKGPVIELAGRPWTRDERLAERLGTADQLAWRAAALVGGRIVTVAAVTAILPYIKSFLIQEQSGLGVVQATYWAGELCWSWVEKDDPCWQAVLNLTADSVKIAEAKPKETDAFHGLYVVAACSEDMPAEGLAAYYKSRRHQLGWRSFQVDRRKVDPFGYLQANPSRSHLAFQKNEGLTSK